MLVDPTKRKTTIEVTKNMKNYFRNIIVLSFITALCIGFVSASSSGTAGDKSANQTIPISSASVSAPSETDQIKLAEIKAALPLEIQQSLNDQITFNENVTKSIAEKEGQLVRSPLIINDSHDITNEVQGFFVSNIISSLEPALNKSEFVQSNISSPVILLVNQIPTGGFIAFGSDGKTRVFLSEGTQISYAVDEKSERVTTPSGKVLPSTHIIGIPNGAASHTIGNTEYITMRGEVILTILDQSSKNALDEIIVPSTLSFPWVEYAESEPYYIAAVHSNWNIPHSPNITNSAVRANILFNGVEPSDGSMIFQPVTAFNYKAHSALSGNDSLYDPAILNRWTGSSWICPLNNIYCTHSIPILNFSQGELAYGAVFWYEAPVLEWMIYLVNSSGQSTWLYSDRYIYSQPSRAVVTYEFGGSTPLGQMPNDDEKISSATFSNISVWDTNGNQITSLHWNGVVNTKDHKRTTGLNVDLSQAPSRVTLITSDYRTKTGTFQNGFWNLDYNLDGISDKTFTLGTTGDISVVGDWNGYNYSAVGVFRPSTGYWYFDTNKDFVIDKSFRYGGSTDLIAVGDWDGDKKDGIAIFRPSTGYWYFDYNLDGTIDKSFRYGGVGDQIIVGKWQGTNDGIAIFRPSTGYWYFDYNLDGTIDKSFRYGGVGDQILVGKWHGNNDGIAIFRNSTGYWYLDYNLDGVVDYSFRYGGSTDQIIVGDWDADALDENAIYRPSTGYWYLDYNLDGVVDKSFRFGTSSDLAKVGKWV